MSIALEQLEWDLDFAISRLIQNRQRWAQTSIDERIAILADIKDRLIGVSGSAGIAHLADFMADSLVARKFVQP